MAAPQYKRKPEVREGRGVSPEFSSEQRKKCSGALVKPSVQVWGIEIQSPASSSVLQSEARPREPRGNDKRITTPNTTHGFTNCTLDFNTKKRMHGSAQLG